MMNNLTRRLAETRLDYRLVEYIEDELGSAVELLVRLQSSQWKISEVVKLAHIIAGHDGETVDFESLADEIVRTGATKYFDPILKLLMTAVFGAEKE